MLDRGPQEEGILDFCADNGVGFISFSPLAQGLLTDRYLNCNENDNEKRGFDIPKDSRMAKGKFLKESMLTPELLQQLRQWNSEALAQGQTLAEYALRWILQQRGVTSVLVGASSTAQLEKNLRCVL
jgi:L-glyceraldehyde 3-phosphate reductase